MKRAVAWVCISLLLLLVIGAAVSNVLSARDSDDDQTGGSSPGWQQPEFDPAARVAPEPALQRFYEQVPDWSACGNRQCAFIDVPLDYAAPGAETIEIKLLRVNALSQDERIGSLVVNPGGPGSPGTTFADQAPFVFDRSLLERYDVVGFDPRGTGESAPVDCVSDAQLTTYLAADPTPDSPAEIRAAAKASKKVLAGCVKRSGAVAQHVSTIEAARDMDVIRASLDERKLAYFGASYGTKLGATYADLFAGTSGRLVLDGGIDPRLDLEELSLGQARGFETALRAYVDSCLAAGDCYLGADMDEALATITDFLDEVDAAPMSVGDRELTVGNAFYGIVLPLYNKSYWMLLDQALGAALDGNGAALLRLADLYASREGDTFTDNSAEAIGVISCLDDPSFVPLDQIPAKLPSYRKASPTFGDVFAWGLNACAGFADHEPVERRELTAAGADPLLVIGTTRDPATPYEWAQGLAEALEPAVLVSRDGDGHTGYNQGNDCVDDVVEAYLLDGTVPSADVDCPAP